MKKLETQIVRAAIAWWHSRRPSGYTFADHIGSPSDYTGGTTLDESSALCRAVAEREKQRLRREGKRKRLAAEVALVKAARAQAKGRKNAAKNSKPDDSP